MYIVKNDRKGDRRMNNKTSVRVLATAGLIAAMYVALSMIVPPLSFGPMQCRPAEALTVLAAFTPAAVPGLTVGCALSNLIGLSLGANAAGAADVLIGAAATGVAALLSRWWRHKTVGGLPLWSTLPPVAVNALVVGTELTLLAPRPTLAFWVTQVALVAAGQAIACIGGGLLLARAFHGSKLEKRL